MPLIDADPYHNFPKGKKYQVIYSDPPWKYAKWEARGVQNHYQTQDPDWIKGLPVPKISDENCFLFLWVTMPKLDLGIEVIKSWGFRYATCAFTWVKTEQDGSWLIGLGNYTRANAELCLLGTKGKTQLMVKSNSVRQLCIHKAEAHSKKPEFVKDRITELLGPLKRIELFARRHTPGWDCWGNEV